MKRRKRKTIPEWLAQERRVEALARILHESGRKAVEQGLVYAAPSDRKPFCEWNDLPYVAKEGRRLMARFLRRRRKGLAKLLR